MTVALPKRPGPRSLEDVRDKDPGAEMLYPRHVLRDAQTALCVFSAAFYGQQDAYWLAEAELRTTCVDVDGRRLDEMAHVYPGDWSFYAGDAFEFAGNHGREWDIVSLDPFTNLFDRCANALPLWCSLARDAVIMGCEVDQPIVAPAGWQEVRRVFRSHYGNGVEWVVLQPTGVGITPDNVSACLVTRGDQPNQMRRIVDTLPYDELIVWNNAKDGDFKTAGRYMAAADAKHDVVYFQDDDTLFVHHSELMAAYETGRITAVYGHGETPGGYDDLPLVCGGALADRDVVLEPLETLGNTDEDRAYADFHVGILTPFKHVHLPFEINYAIAQHPSRLCNQTWAADAKQRITERARAIRDART